MYYLRSRLVKGHGSKVIGQKISHIPCNRSVLVHGMQRQLSNIAIALPQVDSGEGGRQSKMAARHAAEPMVISCRMRDGMRRKRVK